MQTREYWRSRWWMPGFALFLGALMFGAFAIAGEVGQGAISFAIMAVAGALFLFGRRGETLRGIGGPERDERWELIDLRAVAYTGMVLITFILGALAVRDRARRGRQPVHAAGRDRRALLRAVRGAAAPAFVIAGDARSRPPVDETLAGRKQ